MDSLIAFRQQQQQQQLDISELNDSEIISNINHPSSDLTSQVRSSRKDMLLLTRPVSASVNPENGKIMVKKTKSMHKYSTLIAE
jgi:hypothetical protein